MKYFIKIEIEDKELLKGISMYKLADEMKSSQPYLNNVKTNKYVVSYKQYQRIKESVDKLKKK